MRRGRNEIQGAKFVPPKVREAIRILEDDGWYYTYTRGSHRYFEHPAKPGKVTIPGKPSDDLKAWLWNRIQKQAGLRGSS